MVLRLSAVTMLPLDAQVSQVALCLLTLVELIVNSLSSNLKLSECKL